MFGKEIQTEIFIKLGYKAFAQSRYLKVTSLLFSYQLPSYVVSVLITFYNSIKKMTGVKAFLQHGKKDVSNKCDIANK